MRVYISGPMTGIDDYNFPLFNKVAQELTDLGYEVSNPAEKGIIEGWSWEQYLVLDLHEVLDVDCLVMLPGWENSEGAKLEHYVATALKKQTFAYEEFVSLLEFASL